MINFSPNKMLKVYSTNKAYQREQFQELLTQNRILFKIKVKDNSQINLFDSAVLGSMGNNKLHLTYSFYVKEEDADRVLWLVRSIES